LKLAIGLEKWHKLKEDSPLLYFKIIRNVVNEGQKVTA
jgi:hypothetical protein